MRLISLAALALATAAPLPAQEPGKIEVVLADFSFTPATVRLPAGRKTLLHIVNQGSGGHNFAAPEFFSAAAIDPASAALIKKGKVEVKKGAAVDIMLTPSAGSYKLKCTHFLHGGFGMKGQIIVQ